jgi:hypothetical protein
MWKEDKVRRGLMIAMHEHEHEHLMLHQRKRRSKYT